MSNTDEVTITGILERARAAQAAKRAADEAARLEYARQHLAKLRDEWRPIVEAVLAQIKHQLGDDSEPLADWDDDGGRAYYYGNGWILERPADSTTAPRNSLSDTAYRPLKLTVEDVRVPVMCWSDGRAIARFEPADIVLDRDEEGEEYANVWLGGSAETGWGIQIGNRDLLVAIAAAADKEAEYHDKVSRAQQINDERASATAGDVQPAQEPARPATDNLESAGEILRRFTGDEFCVAHFGAGRHDDNRAFLIASQIHALAVEVRELRNTMENRL
ncbi:MAG: hypothetical protein WBC13_05025 [Dokdonella sp.]